MTSQGVLRYLVEAGIVPADQPVRLREPSRDPYPNGYGVWHTHPDCAAGVRTRHTVRTAGDLLAATTRGQARAVLCSCALHHVSAYWDGFTLPDLNALLWLTDTENRWRNIESAGRLRAILLDPVPVAADDRINTRVTTREAALRTYLGNLDSDGDYQHRVVSALAKAYGRLANNWAMRQPARGVVKQATDRWPGLYRTLLDDKDLAAVMAVFNEASGEPRLAVMPQLTPLTRPLLWVEARASYQGRDQTLDGLALDFDPKHPQLVKVPALALTLVTEQHTVIIRDNGYTASTVAAAIDYADRSAGLTVDDVIDAIHATTA